MRSRNLSLRRLRDPREPAFWLCVLLVLALGLRLLFLLRPLPWFLSMFAADDFFYYMQTAHSIATGTGSSFDGGVTHHNGYHPLFLWLLVPGFALGIGKTTMIGVAMGILVVSWLAAMVLAYVIGRHLGARWGALVAPAILGLNVEFVKSSLSGFETALATALVLAVVVGCLRRWRAWVLGVVLGLAGLARLDNGMLAVPVALCLLGQRRGRDLVVVGAIAAAVVAPWCVWSWIGFGSPLPLSGVVKSWYGTSAELWHGIVVFARESAYRTLGFAWRDRLPAELALMLGTLLVAAAAWRGRAVAWISVYALAAPVAFAVLTGSRFLPQFNRYCVPAYCLLAVLVFARTGRRGWIALVLVTTSVLWADLHFVRWSSHTPPLRNFVGLCQREAPAVLDDIVGPDELVGCFDSGALGYFSDRTVVNLDGLVNAEVVRMLAAADGGTWETRYRRYFEEKGITVLVGGTGFSWIRMFRDVDEWPVLHPPLALSNGEQIVFLRVPPYVPADRP